MEVEILNIALSGFWSFCGTAILLGIVVGGFTNIAVAVLRIFKRK